MTVCPGKVSGPRKKYMARPCCNLWLRVMLVTVGRSWFSPSNPLTKNSVKADALVKAVNTGVLLNVDRHPPFREMMQHRHKAYVVQDGDDQWHTEEYDDDFFTSWMVQNLGNADFHVTDVLTFMGTPVRQRIATYLAAEAA